MPHDKVWDFISIAKGNQFAPAPFTAFDSTPGIGLLSFAGTLVNTARFWSDNQLLPAPGIRDRVVSIALRDDEDGLNLDMSAKVIADLDWRGRAAGMLIAARFDPLTERDPETGDPNEPVFANHRRVRFRAFMASFEDMSRRFARSRRASDTVRLCAANCGPWPTTIRVPKALIFLDSAGREGRGQRVPKPATLPPAPA
jgi:hypothetical protein